MGIVRRVCGLHRRTYVDERVAPATTAAQGVVFARVGLSRGVLLIALTRSSCKLLILFLYVRLRGAGVIPPELGQLFSLELLILNNNRLVGKSINFVGVTIWLRIALPYE